MERIIRPIKNTNHHDFIHMGKRAVEMLALTFALGLAGLNVGPRILSILEQERISASSTFVEIGQLELNPCLYNGRSIITAATLDQVVSTDRDAHTWDNGGNLRIEQVKDWVYKLGPSNGQLNQLYALYTTDQLGQPKIADGRYKIIHATILGPLNPNTNDPLIIYLSSNCFAQIDAVDPNEGNRD